MFAYGFMPHGFCFEWRASVLWLHVLSDVTIGLSYYGIAAALFYFVRKRRDIPLQALFWLFAAFILLCGTTHFFAVWVLWHPDYYIEGGVKAITALVSVTTLITLITVLPEALGLQGNEALIADNTKLLGLFKSSELRGQVTLGAVMDHVVDGIIMIDDKGVIKSFNPACTKLFGYAAEEVIGRNVKTLMADPYQSEHDGYLQNYLESGKGKIIGTSGRELSALRKDGSVFPISLSVSAFALEGVQLFSGIVRDITLQRQTEAERERLLAHLTESNTELERFAYVASHDMQEPVRMVTNFSQIVLKKYADHLGEDGREYLEIINASALRLHHMIKDMLEFARLENTGSKSGDIDFNLNLQHVQENLRYLIADTGAVITSEPLPVVYCNRVQIMRVFQNLITNAIKYQPAGRIPQIHIGVTETQTHWQFTVADNGLGIDDAFMEEIFQPFRRLHGWESIGGTGLGLAVCRKIVEGHGGRIWAKAGTDEGSIFSFTIEKPSATERRANRAMSSLDDPA